MTVMCEGRYARTPDKNILSKASFVKEALKKLFSEFGEVVGIIFQKTPSCGPPPVQESTSFEYADISVR